MTIQTPIKLEMRDRRPTSKKALHAYLGEIADECLAIRAESPTTRRWPSDRKVLATLRKTARTYGHATVVDWNSDPFSETAEAVSQWFRTLSPYRRDREHFLIVDERNMPVSRVVALFEDETDALHFKMVFG